MEQCTGQGLVHCYNNDKYEYITIGNILYYIYQTQLERKQHNK